MQLIRFLYFHWLIMRLEKHFLVKNQLPRHKTDILVMITCMKITVKPNIYYLKFNLKNTKKGEKKKSVIQSMDLICLKIIKIANLVTTVPAVSLITHPESPLNLIPIAAAMGITFFKSSPSQTIHEYL